MPKKPPPPSDLPYKCTVCKTPTETLWCDGIECRKVRNALELKNGSEHIQLEPLTNEQIQMVHELAEKHAAFPNSVRLACSVIAHHRKFKIKEPEKAEPPKPHVSYRSLAEQAMSGEALSAAEEPKKKPGRPRKNPLPPKSACVPGNAHEHVAPSNKPLLDPAAKTADPIEKHDHASQEDCEAVDGAMTTLFQPPMTDAAATAGMIAAGAEYEKKPNADFSKPDVNKDCPRKRIKTDGEWHTTISKKRRYRWIDSKKLFEIDHCEDCSDVFESSTLTQKRCGQCAHKRRIKIRACNERGIDPLEVDAAARELESKLLQPTGLTAEEFEKRVQAKVDELRAVDKAAFDKKIKDIIGDDKSPKLAGERTFAFPHFNIQQLVEQYTPMASATFTVRDKADADRIAAALSAMAYAPLNEFSPGIRIKIEVYNIPAPKSITTEVKA